MQSQLENATRVLLVAEDAEGVLVVRQALAEAEDASFELDLAGSLAEAERALGTAAFDAVLLDLSLPDAQGLQGLVRLQLEDPRVPVVVLARREEETLALRAVQEGAQDYLVKDSLFDTVLVRTLRHAMERAGAKSALEESEERFRLASRATRDVLWEYDWGEDRVWWSDSFFQMFGYSPGEVVGTPAFWSDRVHPEDRPAVLSGLAAAEHSDQATWSAEYRFRRSDGGYAHVLDRAYIVRDPAGKPVRMVGAIIDITERKEAERSSRERVRQQEVVLALGRVALQDVPLDALMEKVVSSVAGTLGAEYCTVLELLPGGQRLLLRTGVGWNDGLVGRATVGTDSDSQAGYTLRSEAPVVVEDLRSESRFRGPALLVDHGVVSGMSVVIGDLERPWGVLGTHTARRRSFSANDIHFLQMVADLLAQAIGRAEALDSVRRSEERFRALMENSLDIVTVLDGDGVVRYMSHSVDPVLGWGPATLLGRSARDLVHPEDLPDLAAAMAGDGETRPDRFELNVRVRHRDGSWRALEALGQNLLHDPAVGGIVINSRDVTEREALQEQLRQAQKMEAVGRLSGGIAHDFNNLITAIRGHAEFLVEEAAEGSTTGADAREIRKNADRAADLTRQLLAFSRRQVLRPRVVETGEMVRGAEALLRRLIGEDIEFRVSIADDLGRIRADPGQIEQVLVNLCVNARDAMAGGGRLSIEARNIDMRSPRDYAEFEVPSGEYIALVVSDTGAGMDEATRAHIFDPFFTTKEQGKGTGLGLSTVYGVVKQSGGYIYCYSEEGSGTTFKVFLPRVDEEVDSAGGGSGKKARQERPAGGETILLVEDEPGVRRLARRALERAGYAVLEAEGSRDALERVLPGQAATVDLLLTDVVMPEMGGRELAERVTEAYPGIRTLFMSGYTEDEVVQRGIVAAGSAFLEKPFTPSDLVRQVREMLDPVRPPTAPAGS